MTGRQRAVVLLAAGAAGALAAFTVMYGGVDFRVAGLPIRSRSWERPAAVAAALVLVALYGVRRQVASFAWRALGHLPWAAVCWAAAAGLVYGTHAAGGADSYGYVSQATLLAEGRLTERLPPDEAFGWPNVPATLTPLGFTQGRSPEILAPIYPPGFPLLLAPFALVSPGAVFLLVPLCAAAVVFLAWRIGRELGEPVAGGLAALLVALSPTFLYQAVQPMSDVPVTACWLGALWLARGPRLSGAIGAGVAASLAIQVRPNLAPLALLVVAAAGTAAAPASGRRRGLACAAATVPGVVLLGAIQFVRYGSPLASGYGPFGDLFALANVAPNLARYPRWLVETHTPFVWFWLLAPLWIVRTAAAVKPFAWLCYAFCLAVTAAYLPYVYFQPQEWFYTRFLLPALPLMLLLGCAVAIDLLRRLLPRAAVVPVAACLAAALAVWCGLRVHALGVFELRASEQKYPAAGAFVRERLPASAIVLAMQHSGSLRYYSGRRTLRWDLLDPHALDAAVAAVRASGHEPFAVLDRVEVAEFRSRFAGAGQGAVDRLEPIGTIGPTTVYRIR
jgi:hypothetical protein